MTYFIMTVQHTRDHWAPHASDKVKPTAENIQIMLREKDEAVEMANGLREWLKPEELGVNAEIEKYLHFVIDCYGVYAEIFRQQIMTSAYLKCAEDDHNMEALESAASTLAAYDALAQRLAEVVHGKGYSNNVEYVMDPERVLRFKRDCGQIIENLKQ